MINPPTDEQRRVVASRAKLLAVDAFAGTGKTQVLVAYAEARQTARILYLAFNKAIATQARERFPANVECRTTHSLAFAGVGRQYADKLGNPPAFVISSAFRCTPRRAKLALQTVANWLCSVDPEIGAQNVELDDDAGAEQIAPVVSLARDVWEAMRNPRSEIRMPHDGYLKLWAMDQPRLPFDYILLDEAQDTNPLTLDLVMSQRGHATIVLVGDRHQGIYGFRKACNAMEAVQADERAALTQSFRFGQGIADVATELLREFKQETLVVRGRTDIDVQWVVDPSRHYAVLSRTNAGLFSAAAGFVSESGRDQRLHFVGGFESYPFGRVLDAFHLWADERARVKDAGIARFMTFGDFKRYGQEAEDAEVKALVRTVEEFRERVPDLYSAMRAAECADARRAAVTLATAHKSKGLEWTQVELRDDFVDLSGDDIDDEEVNLLYVALTRAVGAVRLPFALTDWLARPAPEALSPSIDAQEHAAAIASVAEATEIGGWHIEPSVLEDGSRVYDVVGASDEARVCINCRDEAAANLIWTALTNGALAASAEAL